LVLALALVAPGAVRADGPAAAPPPDSVRLVRTIGHKPPGHFDDPRSAMIRSLLVPGWGQLYNGAWLKALVVAGGEGTLIYKMIQDLNDLDRLNAEVAAARAANDAEAELVAVTAYNDTQSTLVARQWLFGGVLVYAMVDAYVDAHFRHFGVEFKQDPALPAGVPVKPQTRLSLRWRF
jgi:hypothetical protein